jgi:outer membrane protein assembly factor BamB
MEGTAVKSCIAIGIIMLFLAILIIPMNDGYRLKDDKINYYHPRLNLSWLHGKRASEQINEKVEKNPNTPTITNEKTETTTGGLISSSWPMFHHDVRHTGRSPYAPIDYQPAVKWKFRMEGLTISSPAIDENGTIYIGSEDDHKSLYAINENGTEKWHFDSGGWIDASPAIGEDGVVYSGSMNGDLIAFYQNGTIKWRTHIGASWVYSSPAIGNDGTIYVASTGSSRLCAVYPNGTIKWSFYATHDIFSSPAIDSNGIIYIGSHDHYLYAVYPNGTLKWKFQTNGEVKSSPSVGDDGTIYVCSWDHDLYAINPDGTLKWKFGTGDATDTSPAIAQDGTIYIGSYDRKIYSIAPNGTQNWAYQTGGPVPSSPAIDKNGNIYCGSEDGNLYAFNPDGTLRWIFDAGSFIESSVAIDKDGTIYIAGQYFDYTYFYALGRGVLRAEANGPYIGYVNESIQFTGNVYGGILPYIYHWDFGDGQTSNKQNPTHNYSRVGNYTATFTVTDYEGNTSNDTANVTISYTPPTVTITKPINGLYFKNTRILPIRKCIIIGMISIEADAHQNPLGIARVEFSIDSKLKATDTQAPYTWTWTALSFSKHTITVTAYDNSGKNTKASMTVLKLF